MKWSECISASGECVRSENRGDVYCGEINRESVALACGKIGTSLRFPSKKLTARL